MIIVVQRQDGVSIIADTDGVLLTQEKRALAVCDAPEAVQIVRIPTHCIEALIAALAEAKREATD